MSFISATPERMGKPGPRETSPNAANLFLLLSILAAMLLFQPPLSAHGEEGGAAPSQTPFDTGKLYFNSGDFKAAYETFFALFKKDPGNPEVNFYLGRSAFEKGDYEAAIMAFERVLIHTPDTGRAKLEIARCHLKLGSREMAKKLLKEVLETGPPADVKKNIESLLSTIQGSQKKNRFNGMLSLAAGWDDNAAAAPTQSIINYSLSQIDETGAVTEITYPYTLPDAASDTIYSQTALLNHTYQPPDTIFSWRSTAILYNALYSENSELNINYFSGGTGPAIQTDRFYMDLKGFANHMLLDGSGYLTALGASSTASFLFTPRYLSSLTLKWENRDYSGDIPEEKDSDNLNITNAHTLRIGRSLFGITIAGETEAAENDGYSYDRVESGVAYAFEFPYEITASTGYTFQKSDYKETDELLLNKRSDKIHIMRAGISKIFWRSAMRRMALSGFLDYAFTDAQSNQAPYDYTKNVVTLGGTFIF